MTIQGSMRKRRYTRQREATTQQVAGIERLWLVPFSKTPCYRPSFIAVAPVTTSVPFVTTVIRLNVSGILAAVPASANNVYCAAEDAVSAHAFRRSAAVRTAQRPQRSSVEAKVKAGWQKPHGGVSKNITLSNRCAFVRSLTWQSGLSGA
jgi:hypothetical protein